MKRYYLLIAALLCCYFLQAQNQTKRVLFIGNSYTGVNNLPQLIYNIALSTGDSLIYEAITPGGQTFQGHFNDANTRSKIVQGQWDYVILQEQSQLPAFPQPQVEAQCFPYAALLDSLVNAQDTCAQTVFYMTWGRKNGDAQNCPGFPPLCTYQGMDSLLRLRYKYMADTHDAFIAPAGPIWHYLRINQPGIELYSSDGSHPSMEGSYAAALGFYATLFQKNPQLVTYVPSGVSAAHALSIRNAAKTVGFDSLALAWNVGPTNLIADFTYTNTAPLTYTFQNNSQHAISYQWNFGDGSPISTIPNPQHQYTSAGNYTVTLTAKQCGYFKIKSTQLQTSTAIGTLVNKDLEISPNPFRHALQIQNKLANPAHVKVFNSMGMVIYKQQITNNHQINTENWSSGIYFIRHQHKNGNTNTFKIVKE